MNTLTSCTANDESCTSEEECHCDSPSPDESAVLENAIRLAINIHLCQD